MSTFYFETYARLFYFTSNISSKKIFFLLRNPLEQDGEPLPMNRNVDILSTMNPDEDQEDKATQVFETYNPLLHGSSRKRTDKIFSVEFMRKYIYFVKILKPTLTQEAIDIITDEYSKLRSEDILENDVARVSHSLER